MTFPQKVNSKGPRWPRLLNCSIAYRNVQVMQLLSTRKWKPAYQIQILIDPVAFISYYALETVANPSMSSIAMHTMIYSLSSAINMENDAAVDTTRNLHQTSREPSTPEGLADAPI